MNDMVCHDPSWPLVPKKIPLNIPKFEGKTSEDSGDHVTIFLLWLYSNYLNDASIHLTIFQHMFTGVATKWYIEFPSSSYRCFHGLPIMFLNHFQLPV